MNESSLPVILNIDEYKELVPLLAAMRGRDEDERFLLSAVFLSLSEESQDILTNPDTVTLIKQWAADKIIPETHIVAVSKLIGLAALDEVPLTEVKSLLERLNIPTENAGKVANAITELLGPIIAKRAQEDIPEMSAVEMPPMTRPTENGPKSLSPQAGSRNIIDLRKQPPTT